VRCSDDSSAIVRRADSIGFRQRAPGLRGHKRSYAVQREELIAGTTDTREWRGGRHIEVSATERSRTNHLNAHSPFRAGGYRKVEGFEEQAGALSDAVQDFADADDLFACTEQRPTYAAAGKSVKPANRPFEDEMICKSPGRGHRRLRLSPWIRSPCIASKSASMRAFRRV